MDQNNPISENTIEDDNQPQPREKVVRQYVIEDGDVAKVLSTGQGIVCALIVGGIFAILIMIVGVVLMLKGGNVGIWIGCLVVGIILAYISWKVAPPRQGANREFYKTKYVSAELGKYIQNIEVAPQRCVLKQDDPLVQVFKISKDAWNGGEYSDVISGMYHGKNINFLEIVMNLISSTESEPLAQETYRGQIYSVILDHELELDVKYEKVNADRWDSLPFSQAFKRSLPDGESYKKYADIETQAFGDTLKKLGHMFPDKNMSIRICGNRISLIIDKPDDIFECAWLYRTTEKCFMRDKLHFLGVLDSLTQIDIKA